MHECGRVRTRVGYNLYKTYVRPHLEFGAPVWNTVHAVDLHPLESIQRLSLLKITGCLNSTSTAAMEVITGIEPLRLRIQETCIKELVRIAAKPDDHHLKQALCLKKDYKSRSRAQTPAHNLWRLLTNLDYNLDILKVEPELQYADKYKVDMPINTNLIAWEGLGNAGSRTAEEATRAKNIASDYISSLSGVVAFTDGSATPNPGPTGAGAAIYINGIDSCPIHLSKAISKYSTSYIGELEAIHLALSYLANCTSLPNKVSILTDCQSALCAITSKEHHDRCNIIRNIQDVATKISQRSTEIYITWVAGHTGLIGNEIADRLAKEGANVATSEEFTNSISNSALKQRLHQLILGSWQNKWETEPEARKCHELIPHVAKPLTYHLPEIRSADKSINRLLTGHTKLQEHLYKLGLSNNNSPNCECGEDLETVEHYLTSCRLHNQQWEVMLKYINDDQDDGEQLISIKSLSTQILLGEDTLLSRRSKQVIRKALHDFLVSTNYRP